MSKSKGRGRRSARINPVKLIKMEIHQLKVSRMDNLKVHYPTSSIFTTTPQLFMRASCRKISQPIPSPSPNFSSKATEIRVTSTPTRPSGKVCTGIIKITTNKTEIPTKVQQGRPILMPISPPTSLQLTKTPTACHSKCSSQES